MAADITQKRQNVLEKLELREDKTVKLTSFTNATDMFARPE